LCKIHVMTLRREAGVVFLPPNDVSNYSIALTVLYIYIYIFLITTIIFIFSKSGVVMFKLKVLSILTIEVLLEL